MPSITNGKAKRALTGLETPNLQTYFHLAAQRFSDRIALKAEGGRGRSYSYAEVDQLVRQGAAGIGAIDEPLVALISENRPEWPIAYLSVIAAGKTVVPIDPHLKPNEIAVIIHHSGVRTILASDKATALLEDFRSELKILSLESQSERYWLNQVSAADLRTAGAVNLSAALIYTSGTTGDPKAVILSHENLISNVRGMEEAVHFNERDVFLSVLPLHHTFEATCGFLAPLTNGCCIVYARSLKSREILEDLAANNATIMCGVPLLFEKMYHAIRRGISEAPLIRRALFWTLYRLSWIGRQCGFKWGVHLLAKFRRKTGLQSIRMFVSGGAPLPTGISRFFNLVGFEFLQGYGLTECSPVVSVNRPEDNRFGSVGPPLQNIEVRIDHPDREGIGEICVRGPNITPGYNANPAKTAELIRDGWLFTGDLGRMRKGHLWITGRAKNIIVSAAGKNIYPEELEERLLESPFIMEALVLSRTKAGGKQGEDVWAVIVPDLEQFRVELGIDPANPDTETITQTLDSIVCHVNTHVADFKRISGFEIQLAELEKTSTKKVKRFLYAQHRQSKSR
jgi:long-chain acyl-CoA synthetase